MVHRIQDKISEQYKGIEKKMGLTDDLEAYIVDLGDASRVSELSQKILMPLS